MRCKSFALTALALGALTLMLLGCTGMQVAPSQTNFKTPIVKLNRAEVPSYFGMWFYNAKVEPVKGKPGNNGAPLIYAFIFDIQNPNEYPVLLENLQFTVSLEGYDLNTVGSIEEIWIPAGKTTQLRVPCVLGMWEAFMSLGVTGGVRLKAANLDPWTVIEKWWTNAPDFSFLLEAKDGAARFKADSITKVVPFQAKFP
jgi:hypothetical protein